MKTTRIKNIVIWALVAVNVFFLGIWLLGLAADYGRKIEMHQNLAALLKQNGIEMDIKNIREDGELYTLESYRDAAQEQKLAGALLGSAVMTEKGSIYSYMGENGQAVFKKGGEFRVLFAEGAASAAPDAEKAVRRLLGTMNIDAEIVSGDSVSDSEETVTAVCARNGRWLFNCRIRFVFEDGYLEEISGRYAPNVRPASGKTDMSSCATAVLSFLGDVRKGKFDCKEILEIRPGYRLTVSVLGDGTLEPAWRISTDSGVYYINVTTGGADKAAE